MFIYFQDINITTNNKTGKVKKTLFMNFSGWSSVQFLTEGRLF